jgi:hypothetical protein
MQEQMQGRAGRGDDGGRRVGIGAGDGGVEKAVHGLQHQVHRRPCARTTASSMRDPLVVNDTNSAGTPGNLLSVQGIRLATRSETCSQRAKPKEGGRPAMA